MSSRVPPPPEWKEDAADCLRMSEGSKFRSCSSIVGGCQSSGFMRSLDLPNLVLRTMNQITTIPTMQAPRAIRMFRAPVGKEAAPATGATSVGALVLAGAPTMAV